MADTAQVIGGKRAGVPSPEGNPKIKQIFKRGTGALVQKMLGPDGHQTLVPVAPWGDIRIHLKLSVAGVLNLTWCDGSGVPMGIKVNAAGVLTGTNQPSDTETLTLDTKVYTVQTVLTNVDGNVLIGATLAATLENLVAAITLGETPAGLGAGDVYAALTTLHPTATAVKTSDTVLTATAKGGGTSGNSIVTTDTLTNVAWGAGTMAGGVAGNITVDETAIVGGTPLELDIPGVHVAAPEHVGEPYLLVGVSEMPSAGDVSWFDIMGSSW